MKTLRIVLAVGVVAAVAAGSSGVSTSPSLAANGVPMANFTSNCRFSHGNNDDPIMFPGKPGTSHGHSYFGNVSTNASSTLASLRRAGTTCHRPADRAAYWAPTLFDAQHRPIYPLNASVYYIRATVKPVRAFPAGLRMIAGNADATKPQRHILWSCGPTSGRPASRSIPTCPSRSDTTLQLTVTFPECWNGRDLDSPDHKSHLSGRGCRRIRRSAQASAPAQGLQRRPRGLFLRRHRGVFGPGRIGLRTRGVDNNVRAELFRQCPPRRRIIRRHDRVQPLDLEGGDHGNPTGPQPITSGTSPPLMFALATA